MLTLRWCLVSEPVRIERIHTRERLHLGDVEESNGSAFKHK